MPHTLSPDEQQRYSRHLLLDGFTPEAQERLRSARVLLVGAGGLGAPTAYYLVAAGIGHLSVMDFDVVELSNLQRQILHTTADLGRPKVLSATEKLRALNPNCHIEAIHEKFTAQNALDYVRQYDYVIDGTDNFLVKFLINDACVMAGKPFSVGGVLRYSGQLMTHLPGTACYRCLFSAPPPVAASPSASQVGVFGPVAGLFGTLIASEAIKYFTGVGTLLTNTILTFDVLSQEQRKMRFAKSEACPVCGSHPKILSLADTEAEYLALRK